MRKSLPSPPRSTTSLFFRPDNAQHYRHFRWIPFFRKWSFHLVFTLVVSSRLNHCHASAITSDKRRAMRSVGFVSAFWLSTRDTPIDKENPWPLTALEHWKRTFTKPFLSHDWWVMLPSFVGVKITFGDDVLLPGRQYWWWSIGKTL